jgi:hypothetical protein
MFAAQADQNQQDDVGEDSPSGNAQGIHHPRSSASFESVLTLGGGVSCLPTTA